MKKIAGSFHFTPGQAYESADNGNRSEIHWDMVCIQRPDFGGGEIWFDDELVRQDGLFVPEELQGLNPDNLKIVEKHKIKPQRSQRTQRIFYKFCLLQVLAGKVLKNLCVLCDLCG